MFLRIFILLFSVVTVTDCCMAMTPPDGAFISSTEDPVTVTVPLDDCKTCDIADIEPDSTPDGSIFEFEELAAAGACKQTSVTCKRTDGQECEGVFIKATTANGPKTINSLMGTNTITATLDCQADGTYSANEVSEITQLECAYENCKTKEIICESCDINAIAPTNLETGASFTSQEQADPGECLNTAAFCQRTDGKVCTIGITGTNPSGTSSIAGDVQENEAVSVLDCKPDGTYSWGTFNQVTKIECTYTDCKLKCETCDISKIVPDPATIETGGAFELTEKTVAAGACKQTTVTCKRTDGQKCEVIRIKATADSEDGQVNLAAKMNVDTVSATLECGADVKYSFGGVTGINLLECAFEACSLPPPPCESCDINAIAPKNLEMGASFFSQEQADPGECLNTAAFCQRTDGKVCTIGITGTNPSGTSGIADSGQENEAVSVLDCQADGTYSWGTFNQITKIECTYTDCKERCELCDIEAIRPISLEGGAVFFRSRLEQPGECARTRVICSRLDQKLCANIDVTATTASGTSIITDVSDEYDASSTLVCDTDGTYKWGTLIQITRLGCVYTSCSL